MELQKALKELNLHRSEIKVYLYLLEQGLATPPRIAKSTNIARTHCYNILANLKDKDLIEEQAQGKRRAYIARDPEALFRSIERKREILQQILPDLRALHTLQKNKPKIKFYEGRKQIKEIYWQSLIAKKIDALGSTKHLSQLMPDFFLTYQQEIKKRNIVFRDILSGPSTEKILPQTQQILSATLYAAKLMPQRFKDFPTDILVWENNIALITLQEPIFGTVLTNSLLAQTFKIIFEVLWEKL
ncbi:MAG: hypothetical protein A3B74_03285 [Candidatus Kerfeldbacteria bacterium RIFCSPHIGHO2_02_FULL_42_14]|uniref:Transcription regulator TrmB N-terminal domain-containing protein n=1 Tax=Candidatus Kerfeldbacteria bacterium RIFCSPHIGHO2_02_FULL_42_14 TaxID=1798540 RepID=A0A1G2AS22_9BACT|nr:MAG: hypothetical protein A3B74_03285 [Candidatus Kerfeldbacteria bacterium RIFCSPHIGHO2_02_FULL_42_14]OGY80931.1 MAG: hypothetical protein A3E60_03195 [Candidatus Kerfeldbacteria bacterium RIFCSPHIGHO2_12_FULL_42_13]OGY84165.1 MAG: hypothetical protein A3I91_01600 [Candidatus Kerfeldbacteria bacterium RIFCSPLOWO2_02_FULL_42_19]OGY87296.1 MAG: hypothetical protein A3G01_03075 [Candidatus Kerfeldbacteria bacterium RIFCSPLOWO2_12_FULL_43_9]